MSIPIYTGIGSRKTPAHFQHLATTLATELRNSRYMLRSGHAPGADQAFEAGAGDLAEVFLPWPGFEREIGIEAGTVLEAPLEPAFVLAEQYHPAWERLSKGARALHARNVHQVLGVNLDRPSEFVVCWTPEGKESGGTAQAMRIARAHDIPIYNLFRPEDIVAVSKHIGTGGYL